MVAVRDPRSGRPREANVVRQARAMATRRRISGGQALVLLAVWTAILAATWGSVDPEVDPAVVVVHGLVVAVTATPLVFARLGAVALRRASLGVSLLLLAIEPVGVFFGLAVYLPSAVLLLAAWLADPQSRPQLATGLVTAGVVVGVVMTVVFGGELSRWWLRSHAACQGGYLTEHLLTHEELRVQLERPIDDPHAEPLFDQIGRLPEVKGVSYPYGERRQSRFRWGCPSGKASPRRTRRVWGSVCADCPGCRVSSSAATKPVIRRCGRNRPGRAATVHGYRRDLEAA